MLSQEFVYKSQVKYGTILKVDNAEVVPYVLYLNRCRGAITSQTPQDYYNWDLDKQHSFTTSLIQEFVRNTMVLVEGFINGANDLDVTSLMSALCRDIIDFGVIRDALDDEEIQELQINDAKTLFVVRHGTTSLFTDESGRPKQFDNNEELKSTIDRLIYKPGSDTPRLTKTNPLLNTRTSGQGFRLSAVNDTAITPDINPATSFPCTSVTIRKPSASMLKFEDFERFGSLTPEMSGLLKLFGRANIRLACVGPTSSGKTTLLNAVCWEVDPELRLLLIQNPTEIMIYDRDPATGANRRNAIHWEAQDLPPEAAKDPTTPTMANMIAHTLRNTPDVIIPGEVRTPEEFFQMNRALKTGHRVLTTWHAMNGADAIDRAATELASLGGSVVEYAKSLANSFDIIVTQQKLGDGSRKVMAIEELTGRLIEGRAETKEIFRFVLTGEADKDPVTGKVKHVHGYFEQVNAISEQLQQRFYAVGVTKEEIAAYIVQPETIKGKSNLPSQQKPVISSSLA